MNAQGRGRCEQRWDELTLSVDFFSPSLTSSAMRRDWARCAASTGESRMGSLSFSVATKTTRASHSL